jgi:hypothetical protein
VLVDEVVIVKQIVGEMLPFIVLQELHGADSEILNVGLVRLAFKTNFVVN